MRLSQSNYNDLTWDFLKLNGSLFQPKLSFIFPMGAGSNFSVTMDLSLSAS